MARMAEFRVEIGGSENRSAAFDRFLHWMGSDVPLAGRLFRDVVIEVCGRHRLVRGDLSVGGEPVNLKRITCPLLNVLGRFDELVPPRAGEPLTQLIGSDDKRTVVFPSSHVGMAAGLAAHQELWPAVGQWLAGRDSPPPRRRRSPKTTAIGEECMSSEPFGQVSNRFKRGSAP